MNKLAISLAVLALLGQTEGMRLAQRDYDNDEAEEDRMTLASIAEAEKAHGQKLGEVTKETQKSLITERTQVNFDGDTFTKYEKRKYNNNNYLQVDADIKFSTFSETPVPIGEALAMIENRVQWLDNEEDEVSNAETLQSLNLAEKMSGAHMATPSDYTRQAQLGDTSL